MRLWQLGCLWNSSVLVAQLPVLLLLMRKVFPQLSASFDNLRLMIGTGNESAAVEAIYGAISAQDFSHEVSARCPNNLAVLPVAGVEWSDLGRPRRVLEALRRVGIRPKWLTDASRPHSRK